MVDLSGREQCDIIADGINIIQGGGEVVVVFVGDGAEPGAVGEADLETDELINLLYGSNMVKVKLNRLEYKARGGLTRRLCMSAEISFYFNSFCENDGQASSYLKPNLNCNLSSWVSGCEPGWSCRIRKIRKLIFSIKNCYLLEPLNATPIARVSFVLVVLLA